MENNIPEAIAARYICNYKALMNLGKMSCTWIKVGLQYINVCALSLGSCNAIWEKVQQITISSDYDIFQRKSEWIEIKLRR